MSQLRKYKSGKLDIRMKIGALEMLTHSDYISICWNKKARWESNRASIGDF
jgi:hypothetical protein